jgi:hypothetical protein
MLEVIRAGIMLESIRGSTYSIVWSLEKSENDIVEVKLPLQVC